MTVGRMKAGIAAAALASALAGCRLMPSSYDYMENWLMREDAVRPFVVPSDIIYVQSDLYVNAANVPLMYSYAKSEVGGKRFHRLSRVFAPLVATKEDLIRSLKWYFWHCHEKGRPFVFIGEGVGGGFLHEYEQANEEDLKAKGLVASFYTETAHKGFVSDEIVKEISVAVQKARFRSVWGREMPKGMLDK